MTIELLTGLLLVLPPLCAIGGFLVGRRQERTDQNAAEVVRSNDRAIISLDRFIGQRMDTMEQILNIKSFEAQAFVDFAKTHPSEFSEAVLHAITSADPHLVKELKQAASALYALPARGLMSPSNSQVPLVENPYLDQTLERLRAGEQKRRTAIGVDEFSAGWFECLEAIQDILDKNK